MNKKQKTILGSLVLVVLGVVLVLAGYDVLPGFAPVLNHKSWAALGAGLIIVAVLIGLTIFRRDGDNPTKGDKCPPR